LCEIIRECITDQIAGYVVAYAEIVDSCPGLPGYWKQCGKTLRQEEIVGI